MILQDPGWIPSRKIQESWGILIGSYQEIQEVKRWVPLVAVVFDENLGVWTNFHFKLDNLNPEMT